MSYKTTFFFICLHIQIKLYDCLRESKKDKKKIKKNYQFSTKNYRDLMIRLKFFSRIFKQVLPAVFI